jgi:aspartate-semialdehyde dehydrogenase
VKVGFVGWRGMVGSVLLERMTAERDFTRIEPRFFTTSNVGGHGPDVGQGASALADANDVGALANCEVIISCQGGDYTQAVHPRLRSSGWQGYWIDAASALRMQDDSIIILDPVNRDVIDSALRTGVRDYIGGNCTVSLMTMALSGLLRAGVVEWVTAMTYQAASGAGAQQMRELVAQMGTLHHASGSLLADARSGILEIDRAVTGASAAPISRSRSSEPRSPAA